jgi:hypothetical protein
MIDATARGQRPRAPIPALPIPHLEEFCQQIGIGKPARRLLRADLTPWAYFGRLLLHEQYPDAIRFLAHTLPKREAVWWGCVCLERICGPRLGPKQRLALRAAVRWVLDPSAASCRAAEPAAKAAGIATLAGCLAMSVFWTANSLTPPDQPAVPPDLLLTANTVGGVIVMASAEGASEDITKNQRLFLALGIRVANRKSLWTSP